MTNLEEECSKDKSDFLIQATSVSNSYEWQKMLEDAEFTNYHSWVYCNAIAESQGSPIELLKISKGNAGLLLTYSKRSKQDGYFDLYSPYGFGGIITWGENSSSLYSLLIDWLKNNNVVTAFFMSHPVFYSDDNDEVQKYRSSFVIDLTLSEDLLWKNLANSHKYELKKLNKEANIYFTDDKAEVFSVLPSLYAQTIERVGAGESYHFKERSLSQLTFDNQSLALGAGVDGVEASILVLYTSEFAEYFLNASSVEGKRYTRLLLWKAMLMLKNKGVKQFHVGGGIKEGDQLEEFKKRLGGKCMPIGLYKKVINASKYNEFCSTFLKEMPDVQYFPPYWKKSINGIL